MRKLINRKTLLGMIPLSERAIFDMEKRGDFPKRIALTSRNVAWDLEDIESWVQARKQSGAQAGRPGPDGKNAIPIIRTLPKTLTLPQCAA